MWSQSGQGHRHRIFNVSVRDLTFSFEMSAVYWPRSYVVVCIGFRQLHGSLGEQDDVLHRERVWSCNLDSAAASLFCTGVVVCWISSFSLSATLSCFREWDSTLYIASPLSVAVLLNGRYSQLQFCFLVIAEDFVHISDLSSVMLWKVIAIDG